MSVLLLLGVACGPEVPPGVPVSPAPVTSSAPVASSALSPVASAPAQPPPPPCSELVKQLAFGKTLDDHSDAFKDTKSPRGALTELFPAVKSAGYVVEQAVAIQVGNDETARALILHKPPADEAAVSSTSDVWLGIASCTTDRGYALNAAPLWLGDISAAVVWDVERQPLPDGGRATLLTVALGGLGMEFHALAYLLGAGSKGTPVLDPKGATWGALGVFGNVAEQFLIPGQGQSYARTDRAEGTGFYPLAGQPTFVALRLGMNQVRGVVQGWIAPDGVKTRGSSSRDASWAAVGKGELPTFCATQPAAVRCARLAIPAFKGKLSHDWIAGLWPSAEAADKALHDLGADPRKLDFLVVDADDDSPIKGPGGKRALSFLKLTPPPPEKKKGARR